MNRPIVWAEVDLNAVARNIRALRRITAKTARLMAVVKADGYGHGALRVAQTALANGASCLGVARIDEKKHTIMPKTTWTGEKKDAEVLESYKPGTKSYGEHQGVLDTE